jgi:hypothetical protein
VAAPTLAWGKAHLFQLPDDSHLYGREFELLPAGTMFAAAVILHGLVGVPASIGSDSLARVAADAMPEVYPTRGTDSDELELYVRDVLEGFRLQQLQDVQD